MLVLRELAYGPRRFSELKADLQGISANVLTQRLTELEARGLVRSQASAAGLGPGLRSDRMGARGDAGDRLARALGGAQPVARPDAADQPRLADDVAADPALARACRGTRARIGFRLGEASYVATSRDGRLDVERGEVEDCDVIFTGPPSAVAGGDPRRRALRDHPRRGRHGARKALRDAFPLPPKVELKLRRDAALPLRRLQ